jgi:hypothetical protein
MTIEGRRARRMNEVARTGLFNSGFSAGWGRSLRSLAPITAKTYFVMPLQGVEPPLVRLSAYLQSSGPRPHRASESQIHLQRVASCGAALQTRATGEDTTQAAR